MFLYHFGTMEEKHLSILSLFSVFFFLLPCISPAFLYFVSHPSCFCFSALHLLLLSLHPAIPPSPAFLLLFPCLPSRLSCSSLLNSRARPWEIPETSESPSRNKTKEAVVKLWLPSLPLHSTSCCYDPYYYHPYYHRCHPP